MVVCVHAVTGLWFCSKLEVEEATKERDSTSQDSGIQSSLPDVRSDSPLNNRAVYKPSNYSTTPLNYQANNAVSAQCHICICLMFKKGAK